MKPGDRRLLGSSALRFIGLLRRNPFMLRKSFCSSLAVLLFAGAAYAQQLDTPANSEYYAGADAPYEGSAGGYCPDGNCPGYGGHGAGLHGRRANGTAAPLSLMSGYPNGINNYSDRVYARQFAGPGGCRTCSPGNCEYRFYGQPDLFYNYYAWPSCTGLGAELYVSPRPVPQHVGHTYMTYQPLYPHEFLYPHHRTYHRYYNGGQGLNRTSVHWKHSVFGQIGH
jgi:hypothetical protein